MSAKPNPSNLEPSSTQVPDGLPPMDVSEATKSAHASPARALQARLVRELSGANTSWVWHSTGLVLTLIVAMSAAGILLGGQI